MFTIKFINYSTLFYFRRTRKHVFEPNIHQTYIGLDEPIFIPIPRRKVKHFPNLYSKVAKYIHFWYLLFKAYRCGRVSSTENELLKKVWEAYSYNRVYTRFWLGKISKIQQKPYAFQHILGFYGLKSSSIFSIFLKIPNLFSKPSTCILEVIRIIRKLNQFSGKRF